MLLLYSDALTETPDTLGNFTSEDQLMGMLKRHGGGFANHVIDQVLHSAMGERLDQLRDDLTLCACRWQVERDVRL